MATSHCALWWQQWLNFERKIIENILVKVEDEVQIVK